MCTLWKDSPHEVKLTYPSPFFLSFFFFFFVRIFKFYSLSKFKLYNTVLSTVITILYIRSSDLTCLITESLLSFTNLSLSSPPPPSPLTAAPVTSFLLSVSFVTLILNVFKVFATWSILNWTHASVSLFTNEFLLSCLSNLISLRLPLVHWWIIR